MLGGSREELLLETRAGEHDIERHSRWDVQQWDDSGGLDKSLSVGDAQLEARARERIDQLAIRACAELDGDVYVGTEPGGAVKDGGLGAEPEPADAERAERARETSEKVSDRLR